MSVPRAVLYFGSAALCFSSLATAFCPLSKRRGAVATYYQNTFLQLPKPAQGTFRGPRMYDTRLRDRLWERIEIEEDDEPMWYLLNCVAGLEMELLYQCREACGHMEDVVKFIVPTEKKTRSHGAKRMVTEHKVKYLGYVFAKLRLCKATYERIQSLDLCRSWMGTVNHKGYKKLPPSPLALNEDEIASFGLEEWVDVEDTLAHSSNSEDAILDSGEEDKSIPQVDTEAIKSFLGLKVDDMVKVTARNKFYNEDGVIRRLKDGKIMVRFLTYGTMFEEWLDPSDVRKLTDLEALRGLSGPTQPITQRDLDGPARGRDYFDASSNSDFNRQQLRQGPQRSRRQDRTADRFSSGGSVSEQQNNDRNWNWYQEQQREQKGSNQPWTAGSGSPPDKADKDWAMGDVDSQWGRRQVPQRQQRRNERTQIENRKVAAALDGDEDWSAFVSSTSPSSEKDSSEDDFFASLMSDLKKDLKNADITNGEKSSNLGDSKEDSRFFDSLLDQQDAGTGPESAVKSASPQQSSNTRSDNVYSNKRERSTPKFGESQEDSLFFDSLLDDLDADTTQTAAAAKPSQPEKTKQGARNGDDDFFAALEAELDGTLRSGDDSSSDFFAQLESELSSSYDTRDRPKKAKTQQEEQISLDASGSLEELSATNTLSKSAVSKGGSTRTAAPSKTDPLSSDGLSKCTVPVLKEMLKERGLKVSGTKAALIDRLIR